MGYFPSFSYASFPSSSSFHFLPDDDVQIVQKIEIGKQTTVHHAPLTLPLLLNYVLGSSFFSIRGRLYGDIFIDSIQCGI